MFSLKHLKLEQAQIAALCRAMGHLCHAGIGAGDALSLLAGDETSAPERDLLQTMARHADAGTPLSEIFRTADCFPPYVCNLLAVGERVGRTEDTFHALADYYEGRTRLERQLKNAVLYPSVLLAVLMAVVVILLVWVLPVFNDVYARLGSRLTGVAGALLSFGTVLRTLMPVLCVLLCAAGAFALLMALCPSARESLLHRWKRRRGDKGLLRQINTARFAQALAMGMTSGLTDYDAADLAADLARDSDAFRRRCDLCLDGLDRGCTLSAALLEAGLISGTQSRLLEAGIRSGNSAAVMERIAMQAMEGSEQELEALTARVEPAVVVVMSLLVGAILLSVMLPLMHIMTAIG